MATALKDTLQIEMAGIGRAARAAAQELATVPRSRKDQALKFAAEALQDQIQTLIAANAADIGAANDKGLSAPLIDRLMLDAARIQSMAQGLQTIAELDDPVGAEIGRWKRPNGLDIARVRVPLGVIGIIYESRPNVTADAGGLCLKAGNAAILRGGSESFHSSAAILSCLQQGLGAADLPVATIQRVPTTDRAAVGMLLRMAEHVDVIVPRGGRSLIERVQNESRVPILAHLDGNCHIYLHTGADPQMAVDIAYNAKLRRTGICGAAESILVDQSAAADLLPPVLEQLIASGCEVRGDTQVRTLDERVEVATEDDWSTEYLDKIVSVKTVDDIASAIDHINNYGSHHTDCIVTEDHQAAERFLAEVDSAIVTHNASTQYADGGEFGMGAEIGISTGRLHARGPVGVEQLTSFKYVVRGSGQIRPG